MPTKQSNKQTQNVKVIVNNKMCCDKPKPKKRRAKPKQQIEEPIADEFPLLNTPALTRPSYAPLPIRNTVYMPPTVQITPEGMQPPIPSYFDRPFTNLVRTMEDFQKNIMNEMNDVKMLVGSRPITNEMGTDPQEFIAPTTVTQQETQIPRPPPPQASQASTSAPTPTLRPNALFEGDDDMEGLADAFSQAMSQITTGSTSQPQMATRQTQQKRREVLEDMTLRGLQDVYYSKKKGGRGSGAVMTNKNVMINRILDLEFHAKEY